MTYPEYEEFVAQAVDYLKQGIENAKRHFGLADYSRYEYDLYRQEIWWSEPNDPKVRAKLNIVGTVSETSNTWLWGWANPHFAEVETGAMMAVREFGEREGIAKLVEEKWAADETDGWEMAAIAARLLEAQGAYRCPGGGSHLFLIYDGLEFIPEEEMEAYLPLKRPDPSGDSL